MYILIKIDAYVCIVKSDIYLCVIKKYVRDCNNQTYCQLLTSPMSGRESNGPSLQQAPQPLTQAH